MSIARSLRTKLRELSRSPCGGPTEPEPNETIVIAVDSERLDTAFVEARRRLDAGAQRVRVVGPAVTLERVWPHWAFSEERLVLTEYGAFNHAPYVVTTGAFQDELRRWLDEMFAGAFEGRPADVLFTSACARFLQTQIATFPVASALADAFADATVISVDDGFHFINGGWDPDLFERIVHHAGGRVEASRRSSWRDRLPWGPMVASIGAAALASSVLRQIREYLNATVSRKEVRRLRRTDVGPQVWLTIIPDWARLNTIPIDAFALPLLERGERLGLILVGTLQPHARDELEMKRSKASDVIWPGLGRLRPYLDRCVVDQAVAPETIPAFARALWRGARASAVALGRIARTSEIQTTTVTIDLRRYVIPLLSLATLDVLRGVLAEDAGRALTSRYDFEQTTAIVSCSSTVSFAAADLTLQRAGARTINSPDGAGSDMWTGVGSTVSTARLVWTHPDADAIGSSCPHVIVAGMPVRMRLDPRRRAPVNVLILNNHGHRELCVGGVFRERFFQEELLDVARELRQRGHRDLVFRWRPHPAAVPMSLELGSSILTEADVSRGRSLEEDAAWADVIVASYSTAVFEVLFAGVPVFVQARPEMLGLPALAFVDPERLFFTAVEGAEKVSRCIDALRRQAEGSFAPEHRARAALFGPTGEPRGVDAALVFAASLDDRQPGEQPTDVESRRRLGHSSLSRD